MSNRKSVFTLAACGAVVLGLLTGTNVVGSMNVRRVTTLTFSGPVALPGVTLASGRYIFELVDADTPDVIHVMSADRSRVYFMGLTNRVDRPRGDSNGTRVTFGEALNGAAAPIKAWYPTGEVTGHQFIY
jgi:hypothetical protein